MKCSSAVSTVRLFHFVSSQCLTYHFDVQLDKFQGSSRFPLASGCCLGNCELLQEAGAQSEDVTRAQSEWAEPVFSPLTLPLYPGEYILFLAAAFVL